MTKPVSLNQQIDEVERELRERERVYPPLVNSGRMRQSIADFQMERMKAVRATLRWLKKHEAVVKAAVVKEEVSK